MLHEVYQRHVGLRRQQRHMGYLAQDAPRRFLHLRVEMNRVHDLNVPTSGQLPQGPKYRFERRAEALSAVSCDEQEPRP